MLQAWGRVAKALKQDFIPYLGLVMPPLMQSALLKVDMDIVDDDAEPDEADEGIATVVVQTDTGAKRVALKTSLLEEKSTACNMLVCYFAELGEGFALGGDGVQVGLWGLVVHALAAGGAAVTA